VTGHLWTIGPTLLERVRPAPAPPGQPWTATVQDPQTGALTLHGVLADPGSSTVVVLVHGIASSPDARYVKTAATELHERGLATLRLGLRGTDRSGVDIYHAGHTADVLAAVQALESFEQVVLVGISLGGSNIGNALMEVEDARVLGGVAICPPVDLALGQKHIDRPACWVYRRHVLSGLKETWAACGAFHDTPPWTTDHSGVTTLLDWDARVVVPRFGFEDTADYYRRSSLAGRLERLRRPLVIAACPHDPMIPYAGATGAFDQDPGPAVLMEVSGGHVYGASILPAMDRLYSQL